jgi:hypothetical protein
LPRSFFERRDRLGLLAWMKRAGADVREADLLQDLADGALVIDDPEPLLDDALEIDPAPAHDTIDRTVRAGLHDLGQCRQLRRRQARRGAFRPTVLQALWPLRVKPMDPVAQRLAVHAAEPGRVRPVYPVKHCRQRQKPTALVGVLRCRREPAKLDGREIPSHLDC